MIIRRFKDYRERKHLIKTYNERHLKYVNGTEEPPYVLEDHEDWSPGAGQTATPAASSSVIAESPSFSEKPSEEIMMYDSEEDLWVQVCLMYFYILSSLYVSMGSSVVMRRITCFYTYDHMIECL